MCTCCTRIGIGKTALVDQVHLVMVAQRGLYASAKFDLYRRSASVLFQAFHSLMTQILTQDVAVWRAAILAAVGTNGQVLVDVIPALELVIGPQPAVPTLPPPEAHVLFQSLFIALVGVFATPQHPLVLFIGTYASRACTARGRQCIQHAHYVVMLLCSCVSYR
jgi:predicted ATPase